MEPTIAAALKAVKAGAFKAEDYGRYSTMKFKGSELAPLGSFEKKLPAELLARVKAKEADIASGKFVVKVDDSQPKPGAK
jgi:basic membrane lipoprotein Med (substrate-binding protein (PBP1-ABC) superfamily)